MADQLTPRQTAILKMMRSSVQANGYAPTLREIGAAVGLASTSSVSFQLRQIQMKGWIKLNANTTRGLVLLDPSSGAGGES